MKKPVLFCIFFIATLTLAACGAAKPDPTATPEAPVIAEGMIVTDGRLEPVRFASMSFNASGMIRDILVAEGDKVEPGQVLARLDNIELLIADEIKAQEAYLLAQQTLNLSEPEALKDLAKAYETFRSAQQKLDEFSIPVEFIGKTPSEAVVSTGESVEKARAAYDPYHGYKQTTKFVKDLKRKLDDAWADYNQAVKWMNLEADLENARIELDQAKKEFDNLGSSGSTDNSAAKAKFAVAEANLASARAALQNAELKAPFAGTITGVDIKSGESVSPNQPVFTIADFSSWIVKTTDLTEIDVVDLEEKQPATITLDALPDAPLNGEVMNISQAFTEVQGDVVYEVIVKLTESQPQMRWGMTAEVKLQR
jgi:HlyD family secretion protein